MFFANQVNVLKPIHKTSLKSKIMEASPVPISVSAVNNATTRDVESEIEVSQESKVREIVMDNVNSGSKVSSHQIFPPTLCECQSRLDNHKYMKKLTMISYIYPLCLDTKSSG